MSVVVNAEFLRREMARRGLSAKQLARDAKLSAATVIAAVAGRPIATGSLKLIDETLAGIPVLHFEGLVMDLDDADRVHLTSRGASERSRRKSDRTPPKDIRGVSDRA